VLRYVPLFRDLLRAQLAFEDHGRMVELNRRASEWYAQQGMWDEAVAQCARAGDGAGVTKLLTEHLLVGRLLCEPASGGLRLAAKAAQASQASADDHIVAAALAYAADDLVGCAAHLTAARGREELSDPALVTVAVIDALRAGACEDARSAAALAARAEELVTAHGIGFGTPSPPGDLAALVRLARATAAMRLGDVDQAALLLRQALESSTASWSSRFRSECLAHLAVLDAHAGRVSKAILEATEAVQDSEVSDAGVVIRRAPTGRPEAFGTSLQSAAHLARAYVALEEHDLATSEGHLARATRHPAPTWRALRETVAAGIERSRGHVRSAVERLDGVMADIAGSDPWVTDWLRVESSGLKVALGEPREALAGLDQVTCEHDHATAAKAAAHLASGELDAATRCLRQVRTGGSPTLRARVVHQLVGASITASESPQRATLAVREALRLARPEGLRRPFFESGPVLLALISGDERRSGSTWLHSEPGPSADVPVRHASAAEPAGQIVAQLTPRELDVLRCLNELLSTDEIAEKLFVSVNTVRTHVRNILSKLGVTRRSAAVRAARKLGLIRLP
jgi:LuxR family maltose regulon positive regulatory protein